MFMHPALSRTHAALFFLLMTLSSCVTAAPPITVCFNPGGDCLNSVAAEIAKARTELRIQAYSLNAKNVADAVVEARKSGVNVGIILDKGSNAAESNATYFFTMNGIPTWLDSNHAVADGNVIIIDKAIVIAGSFNFTKEAENRNAENVMIIRSNRVAAMYLENWDLHRSHADEFRQAAAPQPPLNGKKEKKPVKLKKKKSTKKDSGTS